MFVHINTANKPLLFPLSVLSLASSHGNHSNPPIQTARDWWIMGKVKSNWWSLADVTYSCSYFRRDIVGLHKAAPANLLLIVSAP